MATEMPIPLAIIGIGCRLPGDATNPSKLWDLLASGRNAWSPVPKDRWNEAAFRHPNSDDANGTHNHSGGHFLQQDVGEFDAGFFSLLPQEASAMDPQQRLLLETTYEALEAAGIPLEQVRGSNTAVHMAMFTRDYDRNVYKDVLDIPKYHVTGTGEAILANRISHLFDLRGPSMTIDTGCSGGMTAVHQACASLRSGETDLALAGAANLILSPDHMISMSNLHMLNSDGKSYSFDSRGEGYGRGEGIVTFAIKRLDDALRSKDPIRAVIRETAINQDGRTNGITLPSSEAQAVLQKRAWSNIGFAPSEAAYVEAHGTGTAAGDERELAALSSVFCSNRDTPLFVGSIKSNIGHLESVSGLAALVKATMMLERGSIPPNVNFIAPKASLELDQKNITIPTSSQELSRNPQTKISVNSFGYGGTNAHAILERSPRPLSRATESSQSSGPQLFVLSGKSRESLPAVATDLQKWASQRDMDVSLADLSYTLCHRRSAFPWRFSCVANTGAELIEALGKGSKTDAATRVPSEVKLAFVFTGQGAQWSRMGCELLTFPVFRDSMTSSRDTLHGLGAKWDLIDELLAEKDNSGLHKAELAQPVTTAVQIALVDLLRSFDIMPESVVGHSSGEIAAAYCAGYLTKTAALCTSFHRGFSSAISRSKGFTEGLMLAVGLGEDDVAPYLTKLNSGKAVVACQNSPSSTTVSGDKAAVEELSEALTKDAVFNRKLNVDTAYHSHHMEAAAPEYRTSISEVDTSRSDGSIRFFSSVTGEEKESDFGPDYWTSNLVSRVRFCDALQELSRSQQSSAQHSNAHHVFIEIGPHSALAGPARQCLSAIPQQIAYDYSSVLVRGSIATQSMLTAIGKLFERGFDFDMTAVSTLTHDQEAVQVIPDLPTYPWDHSKRYWHESRISREYRLRTHPYHDLLGTKMTESTTLEPRWRHMIGLSGLPWLADHVVDGLIIFPGAGYLCMATEAARQLAEDKYPGQSLSRVILKDISFLRGLVVPEAPARVEAQMSFSPVRDSPSDGRTPSYKFTVAAYSEEAIWHEYCHGTVSVELGSALDITVDSAANLNTENVTLAGSSTKILNKQELYDDLDVLGNTYGPMFSGISRLVLDKEQAVSFAAVPNVASSMPSNFMQPHLIHPTTLDILLHSSLPLVHQALGRGSVMPVHINEIELSASISSHAGANFAVTATLNGSHHRAAEVDLSVSSGNQLGGQTILSVAGMELRSLASSENVDEASGIRDICHELNWDIDADFLRTGDLEMDGGLPSRKDKLNILDDATTIYISRCLDTVRRKGLGLPEGHHKLLIEWMTRHIATKKRIEGSERTILELASKQGVEGEFLCRLGAKLVEVVTGKANALQIMLEDDLLYRVYADDSSARCYALMSQYVKRLSFKHANLSVLEIGGGTGGATLPFLNALQMEGTRPAVYDFTDVSAGFFDRAREKLQEWSASVNFKTLDIEQDPLQQGFQEGSYDVVVASNVLHATSKINDTLSKVRRLLKPNGTLLLIEVTNPQPYLNITFGTLSGWWKGVEDRRVDGPLLPAAKWETAFSECGLAMQLEAVDDTNSPLSSLIVGRAIDDSHTALSTVQLILDDEYIPAELNTFAEAYSQKLKANGYSSNSCGWDDVTYDDADVHIVLDNGFNPILANAKPWKFHAITSLLKSHSKVLWISCSGDGQGSSSARKHLIHGLARTAHAENEDLQLITVDLQMSINDNMHSLVETLLSIFGRLCTFTRETSEREYVIRPDAILVPRVRPSERLNNWTSSKDFSGVTKTLAFKSPKVMFRLEPGNDHKTESLRFIQDNSYRQMLALDEIEIDVQAIGLPSDGIKSTTWEYAGIVTSVGAEISHLKVGDRVVTIDAVPCANRLRVKGSMAHHTPDTIPLDVAASAPAALITACRCLIDVAHVENGQTVLINGVDSHAGQAALAVAIHLGARVYVTAPKEVTSSPSTTPQLPPERIIPHGQQEARRTLRDLTISGFDVIINASSSQISPAITSFIQPFGTFVDLIKSSENHSKQATPRMPPNTTVVSFALEPFIAAKPQDASRLLNLALSLLANGMKMGNSYTSTGELQSINGRLNSDRTKQIIIVDETSEVQVSQPNRSSLVLDAQSAFVVAGGLGDLGKRFLRLMAKAGAKNLVTLSRTGAEYSELKSLQAELSVLGEDCKLHSLQCDIADIQSVQDAREKMRSLGLMHVKGVVQAAVVLQDATLENMTTEVFKGLLKTKMHGTLNLQQAFSEDDLDFFISLSSAVGVIGTSGQANYNAGNNLQDALAQFYTGSRCHYMSLNIGTIEDAEATVGNQARIQALQRHGLTAIKPAELLSFFQYSMSSEAREEACHQAIIGFNAESIARTTAVNGTAKSPMFTHVRVTQEEEIDQAAGSQKKSFQDILSETQNMEDISLFIATTIGEKLSKLVAIDASEIDLHRSVSDYGLDSLIAIELRNWVMREFGSPLQSSEVLDNGDLIALGVKVASRSPFVQDLSDETSGSEDGRVSTAATSRSASTDLLGKKHLEATLPALPTPDVKSTVDQLIDSRRALASDSELNEVTAAADRFLQHDGPELQKRLQGSDDARHAAYEHNVYLSRREPLQDYSTFFFGHAVDGVPQHTQTERAAILTLAALEYKMRLEFGTAPQDTLNDTPLCMESQAWLFHTAREPHIATDIVVKHPANKYVAVLKDGRIFRMHVSANASLTMLIAAFDKIQETEPIGATGLAALTSLGRDEWATHRQTLLADPSARKVIEAVETAAFVVCLDSAAPESPAERCTAFMLGGCTAENRWLDKNLQFAIASNGVSALVGEHSKLDGLSVRQLCEATTESIVEHTTAKIANLRNNDAALSGTIVVEQLLYETLGSADAAILAQTSHFSSTYASIGCAIVALPGLSRSRLLSAKLAANATAHLAIVLATLSFFDEPEPVWETVSLGAFARGRIDWVQTLTPAAAAFVAAAGRHDVVSRKDLQSLLRAATVQHTRLVSGAAAGKGFVAPLYDLLGAAQAADKPLPALFSTQAWQSADRHATPKKVKTDCLGSGSGFRMQEAGFMMAHGGVFVHYEVQQDEARYTCMGGVEEVKRFEGCLREAAKVVEGLL